MKEISKALAGSAKKNGICEEWFSRLAGCDDSEIDRMMIMYVKGIDFCMKNNWPDLDTIRNFFKGRMEKHGVHCDEQCKVKNVRFNVLLGRSNAEISFDQYEVGEIYVRHDSVAKIAVSDNAIVRVDVYDSTRVEINATGNAKVSVKNHGNADVRINRSGAAVIKLDNKII